MKRKQHPALALRRSWGWDTAANASAWDGDDERGIRPRATPVTKTEWLARRDYYRRHAARLASAMRVSPIGGQAS